MQSLDEEGFSRPVAAAAATPDPARPSIVGGDAIDHGRELIPAVRPEIARRGAVALAVAA